MVIDNCGSDWALHMVSINVVLRGSLVCVELPNIWAFLENKFAHSNQLILVDMSIMIHISLFEEKKDLWSSVSTWVMKSSK